MAIIYQNNLAGKGYAKYQTWRLLSKFVHLRFIDKHRN